MNSILDTVSLELWFMLIFIIVYASTSVNTSKHKIMVYINSIIYSFSGLLFMHYVFKLNLLSEYSEYFWVVSFLTAITFQQLLPIIVETVIIYVENKLKSYIDKKED